MYTYTYYVIVFEENCIFFAKNSDYNISRSTY
jgi:hypothetical protein